MIGKGGAHGWKRTLCGVFVRFAHCSLRSGLSYQSFDEVESLYRREIYELKGGLYGVLFAPLSLSYQYLDERRCAAQAI